MSTSGLRMHVHIHTLHIDICEHVDMHYTHTYMHTHSITRNNSKIKKKIFQEKHELKQCLSRPTVQMHRKMRVTNTKAQEKINFIKGILTKVNEERIRHANSASR